MTRANNSAGGSIGNRPASHPSKVLLDTRRAMAIFSWVNSKSAPQCQFSMPQRYGKALRLRSSALRYRFWHLPIHLFSSPSGVPLGEIGVPFFPSLHSAQPGSLRPPSLNKIGSPMGSLTAMVPPNFLYLPRLGKMPWLAMRAPPPGSPIPPRPHARP